MRGRGHFLFSDRLLFFLIFFLLSMGVSVQAMALDDKDGDEFTLEEIIVTAQYQETNLQETPIAITAVTGDMLENQNILALEDLGLIIPNANIRPVGNLGGPTDQIGLRGVDQVEFIHLFKPLPMVYNNEIQVK
ncbi:MAG: hypothetical protein PVG39_21435 [Desulfobacteraceae bacterium]|jgi:iron complex outermembrane receptor protein